MPCKEIFKQYGTFSSERGLSSASVGQYSMSISRFQKKTSTENNNCFFFLRLSRSGVIRICICVSHLTCFQAQGLTTIGTMYRPSLSRRSSKWVTSSRRMKAEVKESGEISKTATLALSIAVWILGTSPPLRRCGGHPKDQAGSPVVAPLNG